MRQLSGLVAALAALVVACGGDEKPAPPTNAAANNAGGTGAQTDASAAQSTPAKAEQPQTLGVLPAPRGEALDPRFADKYARRDALLDGWDTEDFNERAGRQLSALGKLLAHPDTLKNEALASLCGPDFACVDLRPDVTAVARSTEALHGARNDAPSKELAHNGLDGARAAFAELAAWFEGAPDAVAKFKIIGVEPRGETVVTRQYLQFKARPASGVRQVNATWVATWTALASEDRSTPPKLLRIELEEHAELRGPSGGAPLFAEATDAAFANAPTFVEQLRPSLEHWSGRIDRSMGLSLIGHEGFALGDADGDQLDDLYICQPGGLPNRLFLRRADGTLQDVSATAGVDFLDASRSALFADFDNDGDQDLAIELDPHVVLLENDGRARFTVRAKLPAPSTTTLTAVDFDTDGDLDLYCCGYVVPDTAEFAPLPYHDANNGRANTLLRNDGANPSAWTFTDATRETGLDVNNRRFSFAAAWEDYDEDGDLDLYVANDFGRNNLYRNDGGRFVDVAAAAGVEDMAAGMGVTWGDYDLDGHVDLYVSNMFSSAGERVTYQRQFKPGVDDATRAGFQRHARGNSLFRNLGNGTFQDVSAEAGVSMGRWAWGSLFTDFDNDGLSDLFVPNGFVTGEDPEDL